MFKLWNRQPSAVHSSGCFEKSNIRATQHWKPSPGLDKWGGWGQKRKGSYFSLSYWQIKNHPLLWLQRTSCHTRVLPRNHPPLSRETEVQSAVCSSQRTRSPQILDLLVAQSERHSPSTPEYRPPDHPSMTNTHWTMPRNCPGAANAETDKSQVWNRSKLSSYQGGQHFAEVDSTDPLATCWLWKRYP